MITRICNLSKDLRFDELRKVLESYGYEMNTLRSGSSHYTFRKQGCMPSTIPKHEPIKKVYPMRRKTPCFSYGDIRRVHRIYVSN
ncbi:RNA-binding protein [Fusicatenibacter sp.]